MIGSLYILENGKDLNGIFRISVIAAGLKALSGEDYSYSS